VLLPKGKGVGVSFFIRIRGEGKVTPSLPPKGEVEGRILRLDSKKEGEEGYNLRI